MNYDSCILSENDTTKVKWPSGTNENVPVFVPDPSNPSEWKPFERNSPDATPSTETAAKVNEAAKNSQNLFYKDEFGNPVTQAISPNPAGGYTFTQQIQTTNNNQTYTTTNTYTVNSGGTVTNVSTTTNNGPITNVSTTPAVQFPTDYNREATQAAIKESINKLATGEGAQDAPDFKKDVEDKKTAMDKGITDFTDAIPGQFAESKGNWFSWVWSPPVGVCTPYQGSIHGKSVSWNICPYIANVRDVVGWLFALFGAWTVYNQMFRKED